MNRAIRNAVCLFTMLALLCGGLICRTLAEAAPQLSSDIEARGAVPAPDYGNAASWVSFPDAPAHATDAFFILPTVNMKDTGQGNEDIYNERNASRFVKTFGMEKGIVSECTDVYAPYYRQATLGCYLGGDGRISLDWDRSAQGMEYRDIAYSDIRAAWLYYMENCNDGRPVVLFGFSQGAEMLLRLLAEFGAEPALSDRLVAAYAIGASVDAAFLSEHPWLRMAQGETDVGVIVSYNAADARAEKPAEKECAINPLNWKTDGTPASRAENLGYVVADVTGQITEEIPAYCGAYLDPDSGRLIVTEAENLDKLYEASSAIFPAGDYHMYDLNFFYRNLQKNVADRIDSFASNRNQ